MKNRIITSSFCMLLLLSGCIVDVVEQSTERWSYASGKGLLSVYFDASIFRQTFAVHGSTVDTLIADGIFSLWSPGQSKASEFANNVNMYWSIDTLHHGQLVTYADGPQKELLSIDKMTATVPTNAYLAVNTTSNDVSIDGMKGDINVSGTSSNITFATTGRMILQTESGNITGSSGLGGSIHTTSGDVIVSIPSKGFESVVIRDDSTGNVNLRIAGGAGITFVLATSHGNIALNYDGIAMNSLTAIQAIANGGGKNVFVATTHGNITVSNY
jgi:hypothetical protein